MQNKIKVSAVIPTYNGLKLLKKNLPSVIATLRDGDELIIVDDASTDKTEFWLRSTYKLSKVSFKPTPHQESLFKEKAFTLTKGTHRILSKKIEFVLLQNHYNSRFAQSCNRGVIVAKHPVVFLVNNDVSPEKSAVKLGASGFSDQNLFAMGCLEVEDNQTQGGKNKLWFEKGMFMHSRADDFNAGDTAWASGGSAFFSKSKWQELGGFDRDYYPAYWEDVDLSYRARKKGWKVLFNPDCVVYHHHETTNADVFGKDKIMKISWRNAHKFVWKNGTTWQKLSNVLWWPYWLVKRLTTS